jgi:sulfate-transporting ATPase
VTEVVQFTLLGLGTGAMYALLAQGVVLIFRGSGVLNLAQGAFAMVAGYLFHSFHVNHGWATGPAIAVSVGAAIAMGVMTDQLLLRRLRQASPLARLIATLGVLLIIESLGIIFWGASPTVVLPIIGVKPVTLFGATVTSDRLWLLLIALVVTALLTCIWRYTRAGWIAAQVAENQRSAAALGWSPEMVSAITWGAGAGLAGLAGVLISPITQLSVDDLTLIIIPTLAAALIGGFVSFPGALLGGLIIGVSQSLVSNYVNGYVPGASDVLPLLLVILVLVARGTSLPMRGYVLDRLPEVGSGRVDIRLLVPVVIAGLVLVSVVTSANWLNAFSSTFAIAIVLLSLVVVTGYAGQLSLGQYGLAGLGAFVAARLVSSEGWPFELGLLAGVGFAIASGFVFGLPALRTRGVNLAIVTLALGLTAQSQVFNNSTFLPLVVGGGAFGLNVGSIKVFGWNINPVSHPGRYAVVTFVLLALSALLVANVRRGRSGRRLLAVRANERAAAASGVNVMATKLYAFCLAGALAGLGGVMIAFQSTTVTFTTFDPVSSLNAVALAVIGGVGFTLGPVVGALFAASSIGSIIAFQWQSIDNYLPLAAGIGLLVTLLLNQAGIVSKNIELLKGLRNRVSGSERRAAVAPIPTPRQRDRVKAVDPRRLVVESLTVQYGGIRAVDSVDLHVEPGEIVGLIGANGAGKTSVVDAVTGFTRYAGRVVVGGEAIDRLPPHKRVHRGLVRTFQGDELFLELTVLENVQVPSGRFVGISPAIDLVKPTSDPIPPAAAAALDEFGLGEFLSATHRRYPTELSFGQRRIVGVARALAAEPSVLLLDEPVAGLNDHESAQFADLVRRLAIDWRMAVLVIEHDMPFVMSLADRIVMMDFGVKIVEGSAAEVRHNQSAIAAYFGEDVSEYSRGGRAGRGGEPSWAS